MRRFIAASLFSVCAAAIVGCSDDNPGPPAQVALAPAPVGSGENQSGRVGQPLALSLRAVATSNGLPLEGVEVQWTVPPGAGAVAPAVDLTDADGIAIATWILPTTIGALTATASMDGALGSPVTYHATALAGPATVFEVGGGNDQVVVASTPAGEPLAAVFRDEFGNPAGGAVNWMLVSGNVALSVPTSDAGSNGTAYVQVTAGPALGPVLIRAFPHSSLPSVDFQMTIVP